MPGLSPEILAHFSAIIYLVCILSAILAPIVRGAIRFCRKLKPAFSSQNVIHDVHAGFIAPLLGVMVFLPVFPGLMDYLDPKVISLAGLTGLAVLGKDMFDHDGKH